jgi:kynurenine formamidase
VNIRASAARALAERNWGRWGEEDERGAVNLLTPDSVAAAARLVKHGKVVSLARSLGPTTPVPSHRPPLAHFMTRDGGDDDAPAARAHFSDDVVIVSPHTGTHVDALAHVWYDDRLYNGFAKTSVRSSGVHRCAIDKLGPIVGRGVLLDVCASVGEDPLPDGFRITAAILDECASRQDTNVGSGDIALIRTGWWAARADQADHDFSTEPGPDVDGAEWLANRDVAAVGADTFAFEALPSRERSLFPVHELLLRDCGIPILEGLDLDALAAAAAYEFFVVAAPLMLERATASPVTPVAIF